MSIDLKAIFHFEEDFVCHNGLSRKLSCNCLRDK